MRVTQHDLSYNLASLDYQSLVTTSVVAVNHCIEESRKHLRTMQNSLLDSVPLALTAERLVSETKQLQIASETLSTLVGGFERGRIKIVNKPKRVRK